MPDLDQNFRLRVAAHIKAIGDAPDGFEAWRADEIAEMLAPMPVEGSRFKFLASRSKLQARRRCGRVVGNVKVADNEIRHVGTEWNAGELPPCYENGRQLNARAPFALRRRQEEDGGAAAISKFVMSGDVIDRIGNHRFGLGRKARWERRRRVSIFRVYDNLVVPDLTTQPYKLRRIGDDFADLCPGLFRCSRCVDTNERPIVRSKSDNHATLCVTTQPKVKPSSASCARTSSANPT